MPAKFVKADANSFADSGPSQLRFGDRGRSFTDKAPLKGTQHLLEGCGSEFDSELGACIDGVLVLVGVLPFGGVSVGYLRLRAEVFDIWGICQAASSRGSLPQLDSSVAHNHVFPSLRSVSMSVRATMPATMPAQDEACRCYVLAQELLPERLEAYLNLGNLRRLRMQVAITSVSSAFAYEACAIGCATQSHTAMDTDIDTHADTRQGNCRRWRNRNKDKYKHTNSERRTALSLTMCKTLIIALCSASFLARTC